MTREPRSISRRSWLMGALGGVVVLPGLARGADALEVIRAQGRQASMGPFETFDSENFRGIGDASPAYQREALGVCEAVAAEYRKHFRDRGFELTKPAERLTVVILASPQSYAAFEKGFVDDATGGHFDLGANRLVTFDFRPRGRKPLANQAVPEEDNTLALVHETIHQLTFNTGVLDLKADVPRCVSEGLATYGETWRPKLKGALGAKNGRRLLGLAGVAKPASSWIPLSRLLAEDKLFDDPKTEQVAYGECWKFAHKLMRDAVRLPRFRAYLAALRANPDPTKRVALATTHLGDLDRLDVAIRQYLAK